MATQERTICCRRTRAGTQCVGAERHSRRQVSRSNASVGLGCGSRRHDSGRSLGRQPGQSIDPWRSSRPTSSGRFLSRNWSWTRLLRGHTPFPFPVIVRLCKALQLEFTDAWVLVDPQRLANEHRPISPCQQDLRSPAFPHNRRSRERREKTPAAPRVNAEQAQELDLYRAPGRAAGTGRCTRHSRPTCATTLTTRSPRSTESSLTRRGAPARQRQDRPLLVGGKRRKA